MAWVERFVRADAAGGGDGTTDANSGANGAWTLAEAIAAYAAGQRINVRGDVGTYANTTTSRTFATAGTTIAPVWWRGFNSTPGDLDNDPVTAKPLLTFTTGQFIASATQQIFSSLSLLGTANTSSLLVVTGGGCKFDRLRVENQGTNANSRAVNNLTTSANTFTRCWFKSASTANEVVLSSVGLTCQGCTLTGGGNGIAASSALTVGLCTFVDLGSNGITTSTASTLFVQGCSFWSCGMDGIELAVVAATTLPAMISNCIFAENAGYGINNSTGANTNNIMRLHNLFYSNSSGTENGFGDSPSLAEQIDVVSPFGAASTGYLNVADNSNAKRNGLPGLFENQLYTSYLDIGAVQRQEPEPFRGRGIVQGGKR